jgi:hypothetical protein
MTTKLATGWKIPINETLINAYGNLSISISVVVKKLNIGVWIAYSILCFFPWSVAGTIHYQFCQQESTDENRSNAIPFSDRYVCALTYSHATLCRVSSITLTFLVPKQSSSCTQIFWCILCFLYVSELCPNMTLSPTPVA